METTTFLLASLALFALYCFHYIILRPLYSPLRDVPAPARKSYLFGDLQAIFNAPAGQGHHALIKAHGPTVRYAGMFGDERLALSDPASLAHVLGVGPAGTKVSYEYPKPASVRGDLGRILGYGILFAEGDDHRRQRKIMNPAFSPNALRALVPTFFHFSYQLRDQFNALIDRNAIDLLAWKDEAAANEYQSSKVDGEVVIETGRWMSRVTLDIIGSTGFGYSFNALSGESSELANAFSSLTSSSGGGGKLTPTKLLTQRFLGSILNYFPNIIGYLPNKRLQSVRHAFDVMARESAKILAQKRKEASEAGLGEEGKDLITLLLRSNMADAKNQMSDDELMGQMTSFLLAGHETTSTMLSWTLWTLSRNPLIQNRLRNEIRAAKRKIRNEEGREELTGDEVNGLEYLDAVTKEMLRLESAVVATVRTSTKADLIPLSKPIISPATGQSLSHIPIPAGQTIFLSIYSANRNQDVWGEDAEEFKPERWLTEKAGHGGTGVFAGLLTFLAGPRSCVGYKFAVLELKSILSVLLDEFTFAERTPELAIERRSAIVMRPFVVGEEDSGSKMPLRVMRALRDEEDE